MSKQSKDKQMYKCNNCGATGTDARAIVDGKCCKTTKEKELRTILQDYRDGSEEVKQTLKWHEKHSMETYNQQVERTVDNYNKRHELKTNTFITNGTGRLVRWATLKPGGKAEYVKPRVIRRYGKSLWGSQRKLLKAIENYLSKP